MIVGLDFDGTVVEHAYPAIGLELPGAFDWLKKAEAEYGVEYILYTMRDGHELSAAVRYCGDRGICFLGVNTNPTQMHWTMSPKAYCHLYIDDAAMGVPLLEPVSGRRAYVDWVVAGPMLMEMAEEWLIEHPDRKGHAVKSAARYVSP